MPDALTLRSPSKINLHLRVAPPDASGFHPLRSWMITTTLHDELSFARRDAAPGMSRIELTCDRPDIACDQTNLVHRAASLLLIRPESPAVTIGLAKRIPAGTGLGGGSGNAATTLIGLNRLLNLRRSAAELSALAATIGSDVPFFLGSPSAIATGRGERLEPCPAPSLARHVLLIRPPFPIYTAAAYRMLDQLRPTVDKAILAPFDAAAWSALPAIELLDQLVNDLEPAAFAIEPRLDVLRREVEALLGRPVRMSGSGSTLFTLYDSREEATAARNKSAAAGVQAQNEELGEPFGFSD